MSYEEKYKEALKRADSLTEKYGGREFAEYVFPELAESEDERTSGFADDIVNNLEPSLPPNLDEAAEEFSDGEWDGLHDNDGNALYTEDMIQYAFKAGAEWMAKQGFISEGIVYQTSGKDTIIELNEHIGYLEDCDEVIVNIRKKEENHD